ncbi:MAG: hypothetical protein M3O30_17070 [Planctomycetota bacterium]|nr:hypothetical protein [Planctomycetota bacterium]
MNEKLKNLLSGAGSILDIMPPARSFIIVPDFMREAPAQRVASDWAQVGIHLKHAIDKGRQEVIRHGAGKQP